ncbi:MAG: PqqD family protein [Desulfobacteraceae bacterium]|nr:PqqD family protein [Desulfobacteraceae bacterium]
MIKINSITRDILLCLDGKRTAQDITLKISSAYDISFDLLSKDVKNILADLAEQCIIKDINRLTQIKDFENMGETKYNINHDISCRIEEPEGAILFNPETDAVNTINQIGLLIWQALEYPRNKSEIVEYLLNACEDVPIDQVAQDVNEFIDRLKAAGFIGEVIE